MRGYFGIGIENPKTNWNIGTLWRSAYAFDAAFIFTIGARYTRQTSDTLSTWKHIPLLQFPTLEAFQESRPHDCELIGVETVPSGAILRGYTHPQRCMYLLGAEDHGLTRAAMELCQGFVRIPAAYCLNVATAGSIVMYDRSAKDDRFASKGYAKDTTARAFPGVKVRVK